MKKKIGIVMALVIAIMAFQNFISKKDKQADEAVSYSLSASYNGNIINNNTIEVDSRNDLNFEVDFSAEKSIYKNNIDSYNLYVFVNFKNIKFYANGSDYDSVYTFQLNQVEKNKNIKINVSLNEIENPSNVIVSIIPKDCDSGNYNHGMLFLYDIKKADSNNIKNNYKYTDYRTVANDTYKGMILSQDFDESKKTGFNLIKSLNISKEEKLLLTFRASNITNSKEQNKNYLLLVTINGKLDDEYVFLFKEPSSTEIIYKELTLNLSDDINDIVAYLIPVDDEGQEFNQYYIIQRINVKTY